MPPTVLFLAGRSPSANLLNTEVMKAKILEAAGADKHRYNIVATDRATGQREVILIGLNHSQATEWEPDNYDKQEWKYFRVVKKAPKANGSEASSSAGKWR